MSGGGDGMYRCVTECWFYAVLAVRTYVQYDFGYLRVHVSLKEST